MPPELGFGAGDQGQMSSTFDPLLTVALGDGGGGFSGEERATARLYEDEDGLGACE